MYSYILLLAICRLHCGDSLNIEETKLCALVELKSLDEVKGKNLNLGQCITVHINNSENPSEVLSANVLKSLSPEIKNLKVIGWLKGINNDTFLPYQSKLELITFEQNNMPVFNSNAFKDLTLQILRLTNNSIVHLGDFKSWSYKKLYLSYNNINYIAKGTFAQSTLRIHLDHNTISYMEPECFPSSLTDLALSYNRLTFIEQDNFKNLEKLLYLQLQHNVIKSVSFSNLELEFLDLSFNRIKQLDENSFSKLTNLKTLSLRQNALKTIDPLILDRLTLIVILDISFNYLTNFPYKHLRNPAIVNIWGNPWNCNCLFKLEKYLSNNRIASFTYDEVEFGKGNWPICIALSSTCDDTVNDGLVTRFLNEMSKYEVAIKDLYVYLPVSRR